MDKLGWLNPHDRMAKVEMKVVVARHAARPKAKERCG